MENKNWIQLLEYSRHLANDFLYNFIIDLR